MNAPGHFPQHTAVLNEAPQDGIPHHPPILVNIHINDHSSAEMIIADSDNLIATTFELFEGSLNNIVCLDPNGDACTRFTRITPDLEQLVANVRGSLPARADAPTYLETIPVTLNHQHNSDHPLHPPVRLEFRIESNRITLVVLGSHDMIYTELAVSGGKLSITSSSIVDGFQKQELDLLTHNLSAFMTVTEDETTFTPDSTDGVMPANDGQTIFVTLIVDKTPKIRSYERLSHVVHIQAVTSGTILTTVHENTLAESIAFAKRLIKDNAGYQLLDPRLAAWLSSTWDDQTRLSNAQLEKTFEEIGAQTPAQAIMTLETLMMGNNAPSIYL